MTSKEVMDAAFNLANNKQKTMKNIHILPTDKPSILHLYTDENGTRLETFEVEYSHTRDTQHIYITSDEEIKDGDWYLDTFNNQRIKANEFSDHKHYGNACKKIILTTDQDLIADGVQKIDDTFLEWFVQNPSCEEVKIELHIGSLRWLDFKNTYKIIIPQEESKYITVKEPCSLCDGTGETTFEFNGEPLAVYDAFSGTYTTQRKCDLCNGKKYWNKKILVEEPKQECTCGVCDNCEEKESIQILKEAKENALKQQTLKEVAEKLTKDFPHYSVRDNMDDSEIKGWFLEALQKGVKWQQEQDKNNYSKEEVRSIAEWSFHFHQTNDFSDSELADEWELRLEKMFKNK
jgi:hypothetical protein